MLLAADYYIEKENLFIVGEDQKIRLVGLFSWLELLIALILSEEKHKSMKV